MKVQHILVPTDFSERSIKAIQAAGNMVDFYGCTVDLIHTVPLMKYFHESMDPLGVPFSIEKHLYPHCIERAHEKLEELAEQYIKKEYRGKIITNVERKASEAIVNQSKEENYDLILMSAKGEHDTLHLMGGTTEKVIRHSHVPVLSVNEAISEKNIHTIMVPIDFSEGSFFSIIPAFELAKEYEAKIVLFNVIELYTTGSDMVPYVPTSIEEDAIYEGLITRLIEYLEEHDSYGLSIHRTGVTYKDVLVSTEGDHVVSVELESNIVKGISAHREITDFANDEADLVVMSTHGRTGLARVLIGSTAEQVSRHLQVPLLTVRPQFLEEPVE
ncbi:MAG: universal stress protein [Balneolaceae bacterium]|nr:universal stress protein [Balneolaceae bacterium]